MAWLTERNWRTLAACRSFDPDRQCLAFALRTRQAHGIWGGLTAQERDQRYPARTAAAPAANG